jgi:type I restriction enzyme M protein
MNHQALSSFIWSVADLLRGDYKQSYYGKVILPFTVLRRLDCVLEATKAKVLAELAAKQKAGLNPDPFLLRASGQSFYNTSPMDMGKLILFDFDKPASQDLTATVSTLAHLARFIIADLSDPSSIPIRAGDGSPHYAHSRSADPSVWAELTKPR